MRISLILVALSLGVAFASHAQTDFSATIFCNPNGSISIGTKTAATNYMLSVRGKSISGGVRILNFSAWPDYVFESDYPLMPLPELKRYMEINHHLPGVPDAENVVKSGVDVAETSTLLLKKTEELTLYLLQLNERLRALEEE